MTGVEHVQLESLVNQLARDRPDLDHFFHGTNLSLSVVRWPAGSEDSQGTHAEDEVYYVLAGRARLVAAAHDAEVSAGDVIFVAAGQEHRFHDITEDLTTLVFWSPPHGRTSTASPASPPWDAAGA